jgi:hypothetical protein
MLKLHELKIKTRGIQATQSQCVEENLTGNKVLMGEKVGELGEL